MVNASQDVCRECNGSGKYVGLQHVERCRECRGTGQRLPRIAVVKKSLPTLAIYRVLLEREGYVVRPLQVQDSDRIDEFMDRSDWDVECIITGQILQPRLEVIDLLGALNSRQIDVPVIVSTVLKPDESLEKLGAYAVIGDQWGRLEATIAAVDQAVAASTAYRRGVRFLRSTVADIARRPRHTHDAVIQLIKRQLGEGATQIGFPSGQHALDRFDFLYQHVINSGPRIVVGN